MNLKRIFTVGLAFILALGLCGCGNARIVGRWTRTVMGVSGLDGLKPHGTETYEFFKDGTLLREYSSSFDKESKGTYTILENGRISLDGIGNYDGIYYYEIKGNTLILDGEEYEKE